MLFFGYLEPELPERAASPSRVIYFNCKPFLSHLEAIMWKTTTCLQFPWKRQS